MYNSALISTWLELLTKDSVLHTLQEKLQTHFDENFASFDTCSAIDNERDIEGCLDTSKDRSGVFQDDDNFQFIGHFCKGMKSGHGILIDKKDGSKIQGFYFQNYLVGNVLKTYPDGSTELYFCKKGIKHGFSRSVKNGIIQQFGAFRNGDRDGVWWIRLEGGGYILRCYQRGHLQPDAMFLYPDLSTALVGEWDQDVMIHAEAKTVSAIREARGILVPVQAKIQNNDLKYTREKRNDSTICEFPTKVDLYEEKHVEVRQSRIPNAGQGLFCKTKIPKGRVAAYFNGVISNKSDDRQDSDFSIALNDKTMLDVPDQCRSLERYRATLGHKICHSFDSNAFYSFAFHPRFGLVRCAVALRDIAEEEEITCNYKYSWRKAPEWYREDLRKHLAKIGVSGEQVRTMFESGDEIGDINSAKTESCN